VAESVDQREERRKLKFLMEFCLLGLSCLRTHIEKYVK
jgi:hypothetical protein